jgi:hypothetical protein
VLFSVSLFPTAGGSARPDGTSVSTLGSSARFGLRGGKRGRQSFSPAGAGGSARVGVASVATVHTSVCR